jgi:hypothetical protein
MRFLYLIYFNYLICKYRVKSANKFLPIAQKSRIIDHIISILCFNGRMSLF